MLFPEELLIRKLAEDKDVKLLMITAGIGRVADFQFHHTAEIEKMLTIDTVSTIKILRMFYDRILSGDRFYTGVMGSISGWLSSPSASVYSAAKAGVVRFIESVNIELEMNGSPNRILDVSPSAFKGSRFYGGKNDLTLLLPLAKEILDRGKVPFYCSAWSNIRSVRNAVRSGFIPAWVELTAKPAAVVDDMNKPK